MGDPSCGPGAYGGDPNMGGGYPPEEFVPVPVRRTAPQLLTAHLSLPPSHSPRLPPPTHPSSIPPSVHQAHAQTTSDDFIPVNPDMGGDDFVPIDPSQPGDGYVAEVSRRVPYTHRAAHGPPRLLRAAHGPPPSPRSPSPRSPFPLPLQGDGGVSLEDTALRAAAAALWSGTSG